jgi:hypothetical protein
MAHIIEVDLDTALALKDRIDLSRRSRVSAIANVTISPVALAALLAKDERRIGGVVGPLQGIATDVTLK